MTTDTTKTNTTMTNPKPTDSSNDLITSLSGVFLGTTANLRLWHWQTRRLSEHLAYEEAEKSLRKLFDRFVEAYAGATDRRPAVGDDLSVSLVDQANALPMLRNLRAFLLVDIPEKVSPDVFPHLVNLRDEIVEELDKLSYLLQMT